MTLPLTTDIIRSAYNYLINTPPFSKWGMPDPSNVTFRVTQTGSWYGKYEYKNQRHTISVSTKVVGHTSTLMIVMAHEMVHLRQFMCGILNGDGHCEEFKKLTAKVAKYHGFDPKSL